MSAGVKKWAGGAAFAVVVVALGVLAPAPAGADEFIRVPQNSHTGPKPDNWEHTYCFGGSFTNPTFHASANSAMANVDAQSSYWDTFMGTCSINTDVTWELWPNLPGLVGQETCLRFNAQQECLQAQIHLDPIDLGTNTSYRNTTACHELGHSLGLTHGASGCMVDPVPLNAPTYSSHHVGHVQTSHDSPIGNLDTATRVAGGIRVTGWALDPDTRHTPYAQYQIYVDVTPFSPGTANLSRPDLTATFPYWGPNHGIDRTVTVGWGPNQVCLYGLNVTGGGASALLGCRIVP